MLFICVTIMFQRLLKQFLRYARLISIVSKPINVLVLVVVIVVVFLSKKNYV